MADVVNLNRKRKEKARTDREKRAEENRVRFGRTKGEKAKDRAEAEHKTRDLDGKRREGPKDAD